MDPVYYLLGLYFLEQRRTPCTSDDNGSAARLQFARALGRKLVRVINPGCNLMSLLHSPWREFRVLPQGDCTISHYPSSTFSR